MYQVIEVGTDGGLPKSSLEIIRDERGKPGFQEGLILGAVEVDMQNNDRTGNPPTAAFVALAALKAEFIGQVAKLDPHDRERVLAIQEAFLNRTRDDIEGMIETIEAYGVGTILRLAGVNIQSLNRYIRTADTAQRLL